MSLLKAISISARRCRAVSQHASKPPDRATSWRANGIPRRALLTHLPDRRALFSLLAAIMACGEGTDATKLEGEGGQPESSWNENLASLSVESELSFGDSGEDVRDLYEFLHWRGYFENAALREKHPGWQPVVGTPGADLSYFDARLQLAVEAYQERSGLDVTGYLDAETRVNMSLVHCGVPDSGGDMAGDMASELVEKWHAVPSRAGGTEITWRILTYPSDLDDNETEKTNVRAAVQLGLNVWSNATNLTFRRDDTNGTITLNWNSTTGFAGFSFPNTIEFSSADVWSIGASATKYDIATLVAHEVGHALGFGHTSIGQGQANNLKPVLNGMFDTTSTRRTLRNDDLIAVATTAYNAWRDARLTGNQGRDAGDIGVGADDRVWQVGGSVDRNGNYPVQRWTGSSWVEVTGLRGRRIAVGPTGVPWVVLSNNGELYRRTGITAAVPNGTAWELQATGITGGLRDIGIGANGAVWAIGGSRAVDGNYGIYCRASNGTWSNVPGGALRVTVDNSGRPYVSSSTNLIWHRAANCPPVAGAVWTQFPVGTAIDLAIGANNTLWVAGTDGRVWVWNEQPAGSDGSRPEAAGLTQWVNVPFPQSVRDISVGQVFPWVTDTFNGLWRRAPR